MGTLVKESCIAAFGMGAQGFPHTGDLAYGGTVLADGGAFLNGNALLGGDVVLSRDWSGLNGTIMPTVIAEQSPRPTQAPVRHRAVPAPYPGRPPV